MRVPDDVALGQARVAITLDGWSEGQVVASSHLLPVVPRNPLPTVKVSPEQQRLWSADGYQVADLRYTPDGRTLIVVLSKRLKDGLLFQFKLWDAATGQERCKFFQIDPEPLRDIYTPYLAISKDSKLVALRYNLIRYIKEGKEYRESDNCDVRVFDLETGKQRWGQEVVGAEIVGWALSRDGRTLVAGHSRVKKKSEAKNSVREFEGEVPLYDAASGQIKSRLPGGPYQIIWGMDFSLDGRYLLFVDQHRGKESIYHFHVWDLVDKKMRLHVTGPWQGVFSLDGRQVSTSTPKEGVRIWDLQSGKETAFLPLSPEKGSISELVWSPDGKYLFITSTEGQIWRWEPSVAKSVVKVETILSDPTGKQPERSAREQDIHAASWLCAIVVNGSLPKRIAGRNLADDYAELPPPEIVLWDLKTMQRRAVFTGHYGQINCVALAPDGKTLLSGGTDGTVRWWKVPDIVKASGP